MHALHCIYLKNFSNTLFFYKASAWLHEISSCCKKDCLCSSSVITNICLKITSYTCLMRTWMSCSRKPVVSSVRSASWSRSVPEARSSASVVVTFRHSSNISTRSDDAQLQTQFLHNHCHIITSLLAYNIEYYWWAITQFMQDIFWMLLL